MVYLKEKVNLQQTNLFTWASLKLENKMELEKKNLKMKHFIKDNLKMIYSMAMEYLHTTMESN